MEGINTKVGVMEVKSEDDPVPCYHLEISEDGVFAYIFDDSIS